ncbi:MAG: flavodoxin family protein, partial [Erysipelotrichaceae bacterium]|nr:flavodoxin family protein [Erysipelotrichaceae bacterium]
FMDRLFYSGSKDLRYKPGCCVVSCRRGGASASFDQLNKYFTINQMPIISSCYWNSIHGNTKEEAMQDLEGIRIVRTLARNLAYQLRLMEAGKKAGVTLPEPLEPVHTNFIR